MEWQKFKLPDGSNSISDIQGYLKCIIKKPETVINNHPVRIYANKIQNRIAFKIEIRYYCELLQPEMMELLINTKSQITKNENGKNVHHLKITEVVLGHRNIANNDYQHDLSLVYICS